jgi:uncharacterized protein YbaR (Trm112 family)
MTLSPDLIAILVCPKCKGKIDMEPDESGFDCPACRLRYPVRQGIPVMLVDEAEKI